ncbi:MAG: ECF-type sigma factor [Tahibacter sp.]
MSSEQQAPTDNLLDTIFRDVYERLKKMASRQRLRGEQQTLSTTELVHETFLRMDDAKFAYQDSAEFFAYAARAMRHILTDAFRRRLQLKRGGNQFRLDMDDPAVAALEVSPQLALQLDDALGALQREFPRASKVVELHYFAGVEMQNIAELLGVDRRTLHRDWCYARAFLAARTGT